MTWWMDFTYTRTQSGSDIGITRTVRRLRDELLAAGHPVATVAFHRSGFRAASPAVAVSSQGERHELFRIITGGVARKVVAYALKAVPWHWLQSLWQRTSTAAFDALSTGSAPAAMRPGDVLLLADASWNYAAWEAACRARASGVAVVLLVYDLMPLRHPEFCFPLVPRLYGRWLGEMLGCSDAVVCISQATQNDVVAWAAERRIALPPIAHFRLGSDPGPGEPSGTVRSAIHRFLGAGVPCFSAVGSFEPKKNYEAMLGAFEQLWLGGVKAKLLLVGRPTTDCADLLARLDRHPRREDLLMVVHDASDAEVVALYAQSRALVLASLFEGFGLALVEARTRGCPVIANDLPVFRELADAGVTFFDVGAPQGLVAAVRRHLQRDHRGEAEPMQPFRWRDSATQLVERVMQVLPSADWGYSSASPSGESGAAPSLPRSVIQAPP